MGSFPQRFLKRCLKIMIFIIANCFKSILNIESKPLLLVGSLLSELEILLTSCILLSLQFLGLNFFSLFFKNGFNENSSVLELITL